MRKLPVLLLVAACGSSSNPTTPPQPDAFQPPPPSPDAAIDAPGVDAAPDAFVQKDAATGVTPSKIWAVGDFITNNTTVAGRFLSTDTLPFNPTTPITTIAPGGTAVLATAGAATQFVFDASLDGTRTAFVADLTTPGTFDVYLADGAGANATLLVPGAANIDYTSLQFSPDGTKLAYVADSAAADNAFDLYVVATSGTPAPVQVSPARPAGTATPSKLNVFTQFSWSADSKLLGFSGDLTTDGLTEGYVVDTTQATPAAVTLLADTDITAPSVGVRGTPQFDAQDNIYFRASVDGTLQFKLFSATLSTPRVDITSTLPARGDASTPDIGALGIDPTGTKLVVGSDTPTATDYDMYLVALGATPTATKLTNLAAIGHANFNIPLFFSPDGASVAYIADFTTSGVNEPFVTKLDGSDTHRLFAITVTNADTEWLQWSVDGTQLFAQGDLEVNNDTKLYRLDPTATDQALTLAVDVPTSGDVANVLVRP